YESTQALAVASAWRQCSGVGALAVRRTRILGKTRDSGVSLSGWVDQRARNFAVTGKFGSSSPKSFISGARLRKNVSSADALTWTSAMSSVVSSRKRSLIVQRVGS